MYVRTYVRSKYINYFRVVVSERKDLRRYVWYTIFPMVKRKIYDYSIVQYGKYDSTVPLMQKE